MRMATRHIAFMNNELAQMTAELAKAAGMTRGALLLKAEDFRARAEKCDDAGNLALSAGMPKTAERKFKDVDFWYAKADEFRAAAQMM